MLHKSKPITNSLRHVIKLKKFLLSKTNRLIKSLYYPYHSTGGRSSITGNITSWHRGGGHKKLYRVIDFDNDQKFSIVLATEYDPLRTSFVSLNFDIINKRFFRTLAVNFVSAGALIVTNDNINDIKLGYRSSLKNIPTGTVVSCVSPSKNSKAKLVRCAGSYGQLIQVNSIKSKIKLPSNKIIEVSSNSFGTIGLISNTKNNLVCLGKAGKSRLQGRRPVVRGIAMNPVDHPHGGRTNGGCPSVTPWGLPTKSGFYLKKKHIKR
jgi:large subunit ribosomal protein L2